MVFWNFFCRCYLSAPFTFIQLIHTFPCMAHCQEDGAGHSILFFKHFPYYVSSFFPYMIYIFPYSHSLPLSHATVCDLIFQTVSIRTTAPQLIRYTQEPGRSLYYCMSLRHWDQRGHEPEPTAGRYAPKGESPKESPHNHHLRLKGNKDI